MEMFIARQLDGAQVDNKTRPCKSRCPQAAAGHLQIVGQGAVNAVNSGV